jgi:hypothetical protein
MHGKGYTFLCSIDFFLSSVAWRMEGYFIQSSSYDGFLFSRASLSDFGMIPSLELWLLS